MPLKMQIADSYDQPVWQSWFQDLPEAVAQFPEKSLLQGGRNQLFRCRFEGVDLVVKRFPNDGAWKKTVYRIWDTKAKRSYLHTQRLNQAGLSSPAPVAWLEAWEGQWLNESFYVCLFVPFEHEARKLHQLHLPQREEKARLLGHSLAKMHCAEILHLDLTPGNLLYTPRQSSGWDIQIVDNNRMRFGPVPRRAAITSLAQADLPDDLLSPMLSTYAESVRIPVGELEKAYRRRSQSYALKWRIKNATRPLRRKIGL
jgi:tRNA A-37 threonylcarbamoyl transferase component Bud32